MIFNENCGIAEQSRRKGSKVYIEGSLQTRKWEDQPGPERYTTEVVLQGFNGQRTMLDGKSATAPARPTRAVAISDGPGPLRAAARAAARAVLHKELDDEIPFQRTHWSTRRDPPVSRRLNHDA